MSNSRPTVQALQANPLAFARSFQQAPGPPMAVRPLLPSDAAALGDYFHGLSEETRRRFGPHPLDAATAERLCASIDVSAVLRVVATTDGRAGEIIIAYSLMVLGVPDHELQRYARYGVALDPQADCTVAPSVADAYQNAGVGSRCFAYLIDIARDLGLRRMVLLGGTQASNQRAIHFYAKHGFRKMGSYEHPPQMLNYDMFLELSPITVS